MRSPISVERSGGGIRHTNLPCLARTWCSVMFEWTVFGITVGASVPRLRKGTPPEPREPLVLADTVPRWACGCIANGFGAHGLDCQHPLPLEWRTGMDP